MELMYVENETRNECVSDALRGLSRIRASFDRHYSLLARCCKERSVEADGYARQMEEEGREAGRMLMSAAFCALSGDFSEKAEDIKEAIKDNALLHAIFNDIDIEDYLAAASRLEEEGKEEKEGAPLSAYAQEMERAMFAVSPAFMAADAIEEEAFEIWKAGIIRDRAETGDVRERMEEKREKGLSHIREILAAASYAIRCTRDYMACAGKDGEEKEEEGRLFAVCRARACAFSVSGGELLCRRERDEKKEEGKEEDRAAIVPDALTVLHLDGSISMADTKEEALLAMKEDLETISRCSYPPAARELFKRAADAAGGTSAMTREEADSLCSGLGREAERWLLRADDIIYLVIRQAADYIRFVYCA